MWWVEGTKAFNLHIWSLSWAPQKSHPSHVHVHCVITVSSGALQYFSVRLVSAFGCRFWRNNQVMRKVHAMSESILFKSWTKSWDYDEMMGYCLSLLYFSVIQHCLSIHVDTKQPHNACANYQPEPKECSPPLPWEKPMPAHVYHFVATSTTFL